MWFWTTKLNRIAIRARSKAAYYPQVLQFLPLLIIRNMNFILIVVIPAEMQFAPTEQSWPEEFEHCEIQKYTPRKLKKFANKHSSFAILSP